MTDLALERKENLGTEEVTGLESVEEEFSCGIVANTVKIVSEKAANAMRRPKGKYITLEAKNLLEENEDLCRELTFVLAKQIQRLLLSKPTSSIEETKNMEEGCEGHVLVIGLGNRNVTPDALGPRVLDQIVVTRHLLREFGDYAYEGQRLAMVSAIAPGVMAQTGMESVELLKGIVSQLKPDVVITVDALAARSVKRLGRTIQLTDTGIVPGSGVGNHRHPINKEELGIPVIAIGVPTVVRATTLVSDFVDFSPEACAPQMNGMFVTPKDIDEMIERVAKLVAEGINLALLGNKKGSCLI